MYLKDPLESVEKSRGLSPGSGFLFVADMAVTVTKLDVKLHSANQITVQSYKQVLIHSSIIQTGTHSQLNHTNRYSFTAQSYKQVLTAQSYQQVLIRSSIIQTGTHSQLNHTNRYSFTAQSYKQVLTAQSYKQVLTAQSYKQVLTAQSYKQVLIHSSIIQTGTHSQLNHTKRYSFTAGLYVLDHIS